MAVIDRIKLEHIQGLKQYAHWIAALITSPLLIALILIFHYIYNGVASRELADQEMRVFNDTNHLGSTIGTITTNRFSVLEHLRVHLENDAEAGQAINPDGLLPLVNLLSEKYSGIDYIWILPENQSPIQFTRNVSTSKFLVSKRINLPNGAAQQVETSYQNGQLSINAWDRDPTYQVGFLGYESEGSLAGGVAGAVNLAQIIREAGVTEVTGEYIFALKNGQGDLIWGDPTVYERYPVQFRIPVGSDTWQFASAQKAGMDSMIKREQTLLLVIGVLVIGFVCWINYLGIFRYFRIQTKLRDKSKEAEMESGIRRETEGHLSNYKILAESTGDCILFVEYPSGRILDANHAALHTYGYSLEEILKLTVGDLRSEEAKISLSNQMDAAYKSGVIFESTHKRKNGEILSVEVNSRGALLHGKPILLSIVRDITTRKAAEKALTLRHNELEEIFELTNTINRADRIEEVYEKALDGLQNALQADRGSILIANQSNAMIFKAWRGLSTNYVNAVNGHNPWRNNPENPQPIIIADVDLDDSLDALRTVLHDEGIRSLAFFPLCYRNRLIGKFMAYHNHPHHYQPEEIRLTQTIAGQVAFAIGRRLAEEEMNLRSREMEVIAHISADLRRASTKEEIVSLALNHIQHLFNFNAVAYAAIDTAGDGYCIQKGLGKFHRLGGKEFTEEEMADWSGEPATRVYLYYQDKPVGLLLYSRSLPLNEPEINLLNSIADIFSNASQRAALYDQTIQRAERLSMLHDIDSALISDLGWKETVDVILEQAVRHLGADAVDIVMPGLIGDLEIVGSLGFLSGDAMDREVTNSSCSAIVFRDKKIIRSDHDGCVTSCELGEWYCEEGFRSYCAVPIVVKDIIRGVLELFYRRAFVFDREWLEFVETLAGQMAMVLDNADLVKGLQISNMQLEQAYDSTLEGWARALELRDRETVGHTRRVSQVTVSLASLMGMPAEQLLHVYRGALLHDIGKISIPDNILLKPGPLSEDEWVIMKQHPSIAYDLLNSIDFLRPASVIPYYHHERWDGKGYPCGLVGTETPLEARVFSIIDVWDALSSNRPYRPAWPKEKVEQFILEQSGKQFDPDVVVRFFDLLERKHGALTEDQPTGVLTMPA